ncbi:MAG: hypothetical protein JW829_20830 [Pirellulales bacterium]|nr:hypothetical protein [Pirellulales bacterium]
MLSHLSDGKSSDPESTIPAVSSPADEIPAAQSPEGPGSFLYPTEMPLEGPPVSQFEEIFRMDATREWIYGRWSRKSTAIAHPDWFGVRVPLVTGTGLSDLAGSLTYYFDHAGQVQHIAFSGRTGNTARLVSFLTSQFGMKPQTPEIPGEQLYQIRWNGRVQSELRTRPAPVLWSSLPHSSYEVQVELARPGSNRFLAPRVNTPSQKG